MNKYKTLLSNTLIFAIGTFSSKILTILMTRFTTGALGYSFNTANNLQDMGNVLIPLFSLQIVDGITRFGLDKRYNRKDVFTVSLLVTILGFLVLLPLSPLLAQIPFLDFMKGRSTLVAVFVFTSSLRNMCSQFVRARNLVKLYAFEGIFTTFTTVVFTLLFLYPLHLGITGFILGIIFPDLIGTLFLFWVADLKRFVRLRGLNVLTAREMLVYSAPLIPNKVAFWLTNSADRIMVTSITRNNMLSSIFAGAYKIPNLISLLVSVFLDAWQMSSITEEKGRARFFTKVFHAMSAVVFVGSALVILLCRPLMNLLTAPSFHSGWVYIPVLVLATAFSCLCSFLGTVYMVEKRSVNNMVTTVIAAAVNIALNFILIPLMGPQGAAMATLAAYVVLFAVRVVDTRRFIRVHVSPLRLGANTAALVLECVLAVYAVPYDSIWCGLLTLLIMGMNFEMLMQSVRKVLPSRLLQKMPAWMRGTTRPASPPVQRMPRLTREKLAEDEEYARKEPMPPQERRSPRYLRDEEDGFDYEAYLRERREQMKKPPKDRFRH